MKRRDEDGFVGMVFGKLTVVGRGRIRREGTNGAHRKWKCTCECGGETEVCASHLISGRSKSCGCLRAEALRRAITKHGFSTIKDKSIGLTVEQKLWRRARDRSTAKGIDFSIILSDIHVPHNCPLLGIELKQHEKKAGHDSPSLDRIDSSKGYHADNIWVISHRANMIKGNATIEELQLVCDNLKAQRKANPKAAQNDQPPTG